MCSRRERKRALHAINPVPVRVSESPEVDDEAVRCRMRCSPFEDTLVWDWSFKLVAQVGSQAARALGVAHEAGIVHRDIKPENIMLRDDGYVKVLDFGIAQLSRHDGTDSSDDSRLTRPGMVVGTMRYMSPEQATADEITPASDMFSLGIVLYELAVGRHPFEASSDMAVLSSIILREAPAPSRLNARVPREFDSIIERMLAKNPAARPTAIEVATVLAGIAEPAQASGSAAAAPSRARRTPRPPSPSRSIPGRSKPP